MEAPLTRLTTVIIVGGGLAGLTATLSTLSYPTARVIILDKCPTLGGNSAKATSGMSAAASDHDTEAFLRDTLRSGRGRARPSLAKVLVDRSAAAVDWVAREARVDLDHVVRCGGHEVARTRRVAPPRVVGWTLVEALSKRVREFEAEGRVQILLGANVTRVVIGAEGEVVGVEYSVDGEEVCGKRAGDAVILATGGYGADRGRLLKQYCGNLSELPTSNGPFATGDGIYLGMGAGAQTVDMDAVQVHPTSFVSPADPFAGTKFIAPEALRGSGGILLTFEGKRFVNELGMRDDVTAGVQRYGRRASDVFPNASGLCPKARMVLMALTAEAVDKFGRRPVEFYKKKGLIADYPNLRAALESFNALDHAGEWEDTLRRYSMLRDEDFDEFNKAAFPLSATFEAVADGTAPVWIAWITPAIHYSMGGIAISGAAEVLDSRGKPIMGLFACGETTGGVHGANRLAGNSLMECVVFGRIAAERAVSFSKRSSTPVQMKEFTGLTLRETERLDETDLMICRFNLPSAWDTLNFSVGQYVAVRLDLGDGEKVTRMYSPISRPDDRGVLELLVKAPKEGGRAGRASLAFSDLKSGAVVDFQGPLGGMPFDILAPEVRHVIMIAGGVGISAMIQIIRALYHANAHKHMDLIYATTNVHQVAFRDILESKSTFQGNSTAAPHLRLSYFLESPDEVGYASTRGEIADVRWFKGWINKERLQFLLPDPSTEGLKFVICGPPPMCKAIKAMLSDLRYPESSVYSFL